jgi:hypothetical protein
MTQGATAKKKGKSGSGQVPSSTNPGIWKRQGRFANVNRCAVFDNPRGAGPMTRNKGTKKEVYLGIWFTSA